MLGSFLDKDSLDCGDLDFSVLDTELPELTYYPATSPDPVSYTHLDVYKRQGQERPAELARHRP